MSSFLKFLLAALATGVTTGAAMAQSGSTTPPPVAYVYVDGYVSPTASLLYGFAAAPDGHLTPVPGSPYASSVSALALNGKYLFGAFSPAPPQNSGIYTYSIAANGALKQVDFLAKTDLSGNYSLIDLTLDHTGNSLYAGYTAGGGDNGYESFRIDQTNGAVTPLNVQSTAVNAYGFVSFVGNNDYVYGATCYHYTPEIYGFARVSSGALTELGLNAPIPSAPSTYGYCPEAVAADPYNDLVVSMFQRGLYGGFLGKYQLAVYTADKYGNLATSSTSQNMQLTAVEPDYLAMSPQGYYLAATGSTGLQIFLMHGSKPVTALTGAILPTVSLGQAFWDHQDHLYILTRTQLYVFNISTNGVKQAPGSPYSIPQAQSLTVLPK